MNKYHPNVFPELYFLHYIVNKQIFDIFGQKHQEIFQVEVIVAFSAAVRVMTENTNPVTKAVTD